MALEEPSEDGSALDPGGHVRELLSQALGLGRQARPERKAGAAKRRDERQVDDDNRQQSAWAQPTFDETDRRKQQEGEE